MSSPLKNLNEFVVNRAETIAKAVALSEWVVERQAGAYGVVVRSAYSMTRSLSPDLVHRLVDRLLEDLLDALTPFYHEAVRADVPVAEHVAAQRFRVAKALLDVTDARELAGGEGVLKLSYRRLRPRALERLADAAPELGQLLEAHIPPDSLPVAGRGPRLARAV